MQISNRKQKLFVRVTTPRPHGTDTLDILLCNTHII